MSADQPNDGSVESKIQEQGNKEPYPRRRAQILMDYDRSLNAFQRCGARIYASHGLVLFGKLQLISMESESALGDTLAKFNPCNYFRKEYRAQDWKKASGFYDDVKYYCMKY